MLAEGLRGWLRLRLRRAAAVADAAGAGVHLAPRQHKQTSQAQRQRLWSVSGCETPTQCLLMTDAPAPTMRSYISCNWTALPTACTTCNHRHRLANRPSPPQPKAPQHTCCCCSWLCSLRPPWCVGVAARWLACVAGHVSPTIVGLDQARSPLAVLCLGGPDDNAILCLLSVGG